MKMKYLAALLISISVSVAAEGFKPGKTPPSESHQDAGYKGSEDTRQTKISQITNFRPGGYVTLEGYIEKQVSDDVYRFVDGSGAITLDAKREVFQGKSYDSEDMVRVSGRVNGKGDATRLLVTQITEP